MSVTHLHKNMSVTYPNKNMSVTNTTRRLIKSEKAPPNVSQLAVSCFSKISMNFKECAFHVFMTRLNFSKRRVKYQWVKFMVSNERSCQMEYTCEK